MKQTRGRGDVLEGPGNCEVRELWLPARLSGYFSAPEGLHSCCFILRACMGVARLALLKLPLCLPVYLWVRRFLDREACTSPGVIMPVWLHVFLSWNIMDGPQLPSVQGTDSALLSLSLGIRAAFYQGLRQVVLRFGSGVCVLPWLCTPWESGCRGYHSKAVWHLLVKLIDTSNPHSHPWLLFNSEPG